jgi:hypothetical protein
LILDNQAIIIFIGAAGLCFLFRLLDFAPAQQLNPFVEVKRLSFTELIDKNDLTHAITSSDP